MMHPKFHPDMIILNARLDDIERGFQPKIREYGKSGHGVSSRIVSAIASIAVISMIVAQSGLLG